MESLNQIIPDVITHIRFDGKTAYQYKSKDMVKVIRGAPVDYAHIYVKMKNWTTQDGVTFYRPIQTNNS